MNTKNRCKAFRNITNTAAFSLGMTLLIALAGAQEVAGGAAKKDGHASKGAMREMSRLKEAGVMTVQGDENWDDMLGFGKDSNMAEMMTLMMVGGSGMEHMKMAAMRPGLSMGAMQMDKTKTKGMAEKNSAVEGWKMSINTDPKTLAVGKNMLDVTILDANGKPVTGAKVMGAVEMTSMDMGVTKPKAQEGKDGHYMVPVEFSMKGPWRVTLTVTPPKQKPFTKALDFNIPK